TAEPEEEDGDDEDDAAEHRNDVAAYESALDPAQHLRSPADELADPHDGPVDDVDVEGGGGVGQGEGRRHDDGAVQFVHVVLALEQLTDGGEGRGDALPALRGAGGQVEVVRQ